MTGSIRAEGDDQVADDAAEYERVRDRQNGDYEVPVLHEPNNPGAPVPGSEPGED